MTILNRSTCRRLQKLRQISGSVWEGDRRNLIGTTDQFESDSPADGECILWVDGIQGVVRAMDVVTPDVGPEAMVRTLLRAMERPHAPSTPACPQKILVRDRETQFFLRGVLQDLNITVDYVPDLPIIDEMFQGFEDIANSRPPQLPPQYAEALTQKAFDLWKAAPWDYLEEHQILSIELNQWEIDTFYVSVLGMLGMEYGILLYRSLDSLKQFRLQALEDTSMKSMEEAFLKQDCLFLTFNADEQAEDDEDLIDLSGLPLSQIQPTFGNLHPLEGLRSNLYEEEAIALLVAFEALQRFCRQHRSKFVTGSFPPVTSRLRIPLPEGVQAETQSIPVQVATLPEVSVELLNMVEALDESDDYPVVHDDLIPDGSLCSIGMLPWEVVEMLQMMGKVHAEADHEITPKGDGFPIILIQTSQPKAKTIMQKIQEAGGLKAICFNPGEDPFGEVTYELGLLQTADTELNLFGEFLQDEPVHLTARKKWDQRCKKTKGHCGLLIAKGVTGAARGNPQLKDMVALFEAKALSAQDLGVGPLELKLDFDWV